MNQTIAYLPGLSPVENKELAKSIGESTVHTGVARPSRHCRRLRNFARTLEPIYSDNAAAASQR